MSFGDWFTGAVGESVVDRGLFVLTAPLQRWAVAHLVAPAWRILRRDFQRDYALFLKMSRQRRAGFVAFLLCAFPPLWIASAMGDSSPYSLQLWVGGVWSLVFGAGLWFGTRDVVRWIRQRAKPPALC